MSVRHFFNPKRSLIFARPLVSIQNTCGDIQSMRQSPWYSILPKTIWHGLNMLMDIWTGPHFKDHSAWTKCLMAILERTECLPAICWLRLLVWSRSQIGQISSGSLPLLPPGPEPGVCASTKGRRLASSADHQVSWERVRKRHKFQFALSFWAFHPDCCLSSPLIFHACATILLLLHPIHAHRFLSPLSLSCPTPCFLSLFNHIDLFWFLILLICYLSSHIAFSLEMFFLPFPSGYPLTF